MRKQFPFVFMFKFNSQLFLCLFLCSLLLGCANQLQHQSNYANKKTVLLHPIVNRTKKDIIRPEYFDERPFFAHLIHTLSEKGYLFVFASDMKMRVSAEDLTQLDNSQIPSVIAASGYDFTMAVSLDDFKVTNLAATRQLDMTCYIYDNNSSKVIWKDRISNSEWRGILGGPLEALLKDPNWQVLPEEIRQAATTSILQCPLFK